jgi:DNA-binding MarR family transcriptional regulator
MRPLGYWIKEIDRRIEADFDRLLAAEELGRRHWQILETVARADVSPAGLDAALAPFAPTVRPQLDQLIRRGWVTEPRAGTVTLTAAGRAAHDRLNARVRSFRAQVTEGLSEQDYVTLVTLLERVAGNLTPA